MYFKYEIVQRTVITSILYIFLFFFQRRSQQRRVSLSSNCFDQELKRLKFLYFDVALEMIWHNCTCFCRIYIFCVNALSVLFTAIAR